MLYVDQLQALVQVELHQVAVHRRVMQIVVDVIQVSNILHANQAKNLSVHLERFYAYLIL